MPVSISAAAEEFGAVSSGPLCFRDGVLVLPLERGRSRSATAEVGLGSSSRTAAPRLIRLVDRGGVLDGAK